ncbi:MAG: EamA family transporter [SAR116 cluster bacterium]|nr:EamA family transporter [SAR116 cluster bacterium]RPH08500.1 MAG: DMT family transporter [Alphaproteobacteria bacterium TMED54]
MKKINNAHIFLTFSSLFWGFNAIAGRLAVDEISPLLIVTGRWMGVLIILTIICKSQLNLALKIFKSNYIWMIAMGLCGFTAFNSIYYISAHHTVAINLGIVQSTMPAFIMIISLLWLKTRINIKQIIGLLITFIGVLVVISKGQINLLYNLNLNSGDLLMVFACVFYAIYTVGLRKRPEIDDILLMTIFAYIAFIGSLPGLAVEITNGSLFLPTFKGLIILSVIIVFPSLLAQILYMKGVRIIGPSISGLYTNLVPVFTSILAVIIINENFYLYHLISLIIIFFGIYIFDRKKYD